MPPSGLFRSLYEILERDVLAAFDYVEPAEENFRTYSVQFYRLHKDLCGGIESLLHSWYGSTGGKEPRPTLRDYYALLNDPGLGFATDRVLTLRRTPQLTFTPLAGWTATAVPGWWLEHQTTKHRLNESTLPLGNLSNVLNSLAAFYILLHDKETRSTYPVATQVFVPLW